MLSDEEKEAIERLIIYKDKIKDELYPIIDFEEEKAIGIVLNLIEKQSKEIEELKDTRSIFNMGRRSYKNEIEDKIKAKIESVDYGYHSKAERIAMKEVLQSLLEKE